MVVQVGCAKPGTCTWLSKHVYVLSVLLPDLAPVLDKDTFQCGVMGQTEVNAMRMVACDMLGRYH